MLRRFQMADFPMVDTRAVLRAPSWLGDQVNIESRVTAPKRNSFDIAYRLFRPNGALAIEAFETRVWAGPHSDDPDRIQALAIPEAVRAALSVIPKSEEDTKHD